jgi:hypothetical protein
MTLDNIQSNDPKIKIQKQKSHELSTNFHLFSYIKREVRETERETRKKEERRNKNRNSTISTSNDHNF